MKISCLISAVTMLRWVFIWIISTLMVVINIGCGGNTSVSSSILPSITSFTITPSIITVGLQPTLSFTFLGGTGSISQGVGNVVNGEFIKVSPTTNTTYTLTVIDSNGTIAESSVTVHVISSNNISDLMGKATGMTHSSITPMGNHFEVAAQHVITSADRIFLNDPTMQPPIPPSTSDQSGNPTLHLQQFSVILYPNGNPIPADINQHNIGDCGGDSALACMTYMAPEFIMNNVITDNGGGIYTIAMYDPKGQEITVKVDSMFLADKGNNIAAVSAKNNQACWSTILEKAIMKWNYIFKANPDIYGIGSEHTTPLFTGVGDSFAFDRGVLTSEQITRVIIISLSSGKFITGGFGNNYNLGNVYAVPLHSYACFYPANAETMISMRNPWGVNPTNGGYDNNTDGILNIPSTDEWAKTIDLRIIDPGAAGTTGRITPYVPTIAQSRMITSIRISRK